MIDKKPSVALVDVPWDTARRPNPALSLIKSLLDRDRIPTELFFTNLLFADFLGFARYEAIADGAVGGLFPEWLFAEVAFPGKLSAPTIGEGEGYDRVRHIGRLLHHREWDHDAQELVRQLLPVPEAFDNLAELRDVKVPRFCEHVSEKVSGCDVIAFGCTLNQLVPALAVSRVIKDKWPQKKVILGGVQVEGEMGREVLRIAPWVDAIYEGEAEMAVCQAMRWLLGEDVDAPDEYLSRRRDDGSIQPASGVALFNQMDEMPTPDYEPYFEQADPYRWREENRLSFDGLPFISSRGCWWGERKHCTFCGLNGEGMAYRERSPEVILSELRELTTKHRVRRFFATDNIVPNRFFKTLFPKIVEEDTDYQIFYETKSNLKRKDVELLSKAGIYWIQPGIESFSDDVLNIMEKGVKGIQNVYLLKLCAEYGVHPRWNLIYGFPGETEENYQDQIKWMWRLFHYAPPICTTRFCLQRFSPFYFDSERLGVKRKWASPGYEEVFPSEGVDYDKLAFYFDYEYTDDPLVTDDTIRRYSFTAKVWKSRWSKDDIEPVLEYSKVDDFLEIFDSRRGQRKLMVISGVEMDLLLAAEAPRGRRLLREDLSQYSDEEFESAVAKLEEAGLIIGDGSSYLSLPLRAPKVIRRRTAGGAAAPSASAKEFSLA